MKPTYDANFAQAFFPPLLLLPELWKTFRWALQTQINHLTPIMVLFPLQVSSPGGPHPGQPPDPKASFKKYEA